MDMHIAPMIRVAILGASGYVGGELMRLIATHPAMEVGVAFGASNAGQVVASVHPHLALAYPDIGFLHTGIEKQCETEKWHQVVPLTDRVDYLAFLGSFLLCDHYIARFCERPARKPCTIVYVRFRKIKSCRLCGFREF